MSIPTAVKYFRRKKPIRRLPRDLVTPFDLTRANEDEILLMKASAAKDRHAARRVLERYGAASALQVIPLLPKQYLMPLKRRLLNWLRRLEGSSEHDPLVTELRRMNQSERYTIRHGYLETPFEERR